MKFHQNILYHAESEVSDNFLYFFQILKINENMMFLIIFRKNIENGLIDKYEKWVSKGNLIKNYKLRGAKKSEVYETLMEIV